MYFDILAEGAPSKTAALREVEAKTGIKTTTLRNWARKAETTNQEAIELSDTEKDAELEKLRRENKQLKNANEILKLASAFSPKRSSTAH
ncbi:hypothetical protein CHUV2995_02188 [Corynebacterium diphtheriae subsp. lausannense]|nr:hypothetical protein CHUV2995_02188 [Corynebacterium diphtheriae subsp. lausannense]